MTTGLPKGIQTHTVRLTLLELQAALSKWAPCFASETALLQLCVAFLSPSGPGSGRSSCCAVSFPPTISYQAGQSTQMASVIALRSSRSGHLAQTPHTWMPSTQHCAHMGIPDISPFLEMTPGLSALLCQKPVTPHSLNPQNQPKVLPTSHPRYHPHPGPFDPTSLQPSLYVNETEIIKHKTTNTRGGASCSPLPLPSVLPKTWNLHRGLDIRMGPFSSPHGLPSHHFPTRLCAPRSEPFALEHPWMFMASFGRPWLVYFLLSTISLGSKSFFLPFLPLCIQNWKQSIS